MPGRGRGEVGGPAASAASARPRARPHRGPRAHRRDRRLCRQHGALMSAMVRKALRSDEPALRQVTERACNDPQRMRARKTEAEIMEKMPLKEWHSCTAVSRLICAPEDRKTRARLDRLLRDGKVERIREQGTHGPVYLFRRLS